VKKFNDFITEDLGGALLEPQSKAAQEAARLKLAYVGFGRYENPQTQQITHIVQDDRLVPFNKALKTNKFKQNSADDYGTYAKTLKPEIEQHHEDLSNYYIPDNYDENELTAIESYTGDTYLDINERLNALPTGIAADQIEPEFGDDPLPSLIASLDSALSKAKAPKDFIAYISLNEAYRPEDFAEGQSYRFKGFRSTTIDPNIALNFSSRTSTTSRRRQSVVIQIMVRKGAVGMYVDDYSSTPGEAEFLLPRGSTIKFVSGPNKLVGSNKYSNDLNHEVVYFNAELVKYK
jgi:hypothetical protein